MINGKPFEQAKKNIMSSTPIPEVLVVDDDGQILSLVAKFLRANGYRVHTARNGPEMTEALRHAAIDLVVLDWMLPGKSGLDLCRDLRRTSSIPVIMLTAKGEETDRIIGLEVGADDYLPKPFNPRELLARISAVLRRVRSSDHGATDRSSSALTFIGWHLDTLKRELTDPRGIVVDLSSIKKSLVTFTEILAEHILGESYLEKTRPRSFAFMEAPEALIS